MKLERILEKPPLDPAKKDRYSLETVKGFKAIIEKKVGKQNINKFIREAMYEKLTKE